MRIGGFVNGSRSQKSRAMVGATSFGRGGHARPAPDWGSATCVPYRRDETVEAGIRVTREVLGAIVSLSRSRGATPLIIVPQFGPEEPVERILRGRILDEAALPYAFVDVDAAWRLPWDRHPNPSAARTIAVAVADRLRRATAR
jgi:hypothetical protein